MQLPRLEMLTPVLYLGEEPSLHQGCFHIARTIVRNASSEKLGPSSERYLARRNSIETHCRTVRTEFSLASGGELSPFFLYHTPVLCRELIRHLPPSCETLHIQKEGGLRPDHKSISAFCRGVGADGVESTSIRADVDVVWTDTRDRGIGQDLMLLIECDISPFLDGSAGKSPSKYTKGPSSNSSASSRSDRMKEKVETWWNFTDDSTSIASRLPSLFLDFAFEHDMGIVETTSSGPVPLNFWFTATNIPVIFDEPQKEHVKMAACLSPAFHGPKNEGRSSHIKEQLLRWLEWREHMRRLGVERVNWYARTEEMRDFVDVYNDLQGTKDIFR